MVDIQSATAEIRRGKKKIEEQNKGGKYNVRICGHKNTTKPAESFRGNEKDK